MIVSVPILAMIVVVVGAVYVGGLLGYGPKPLDAPMETVRSEPSAASGGREGTPASADAADLAVAGRTANGPPIPERAEAP